MKWPWEKRGARGDLVTELEIMNTRYETAERNSKALYDRAWLFFKGLREGRIKYPKDERFYTFALEQFTWIFGWLDTDEFVQEVETHASSCKAPDDGSE